MASCNLVLIQLEPKLDKGFPYESHLFGDLAQWLSWQEQVKGSKQNARGGEVHDIPPLRLFSDPEAQVELKRG